MKSDTSHLAQSVTVNVALYSDKGKWTEGTPGLPLFTLVGGSGDSVVEQVVLDPNTAVVTVKVGTSGSAVTITDSKNGEATSFAVLSSAQALAQGKAPKASTVPFKRNSNSKKASD